MFKVGQIFPGTTKCTSLTPDHTLRMLDGVPMMSRKIVVALVKQMYNIEAQQFTSLIFRIYIRENTNL